MSNHGGRQLDHGKGGMAVLPEVVEAVAGRAEIIVDGGFLRGTDIVKAMALGANAVGIGRLQGLALAAGGEDGAGARAGAAGGRGARAASACSASPRSPSWTGATSRPSRRSPARAGTAPSRC